jgi:hypothetical protein
VDEHAKPEEERREETTPRGRVELHRRRDGENTDAGHVGVLTPRPLTAGKEGNLVATGRQALGETPVPALGSPDRERV